MSVRSPCGMVAAPLAVDAGREQLPENALRCDQEPNGSVFICNPTLPGDKTLPVVCHYSAHGHGARRGVVLEDTAKSFSTLDVAVHVEFLDWLQRGAF